ncbi:hypothetical protein M405DRAFT_804988, partial [Rhizopogon salebrosus TDB-379]
MEEDMKIGTNPAGNSFRQYLPYLMLIPNYTLFSMITASRYSLFWQSLLVSFIWFTMPLEV